MFAGRTDLLPPHARQLLEEREILISPIVGLELQYLYETGRTSEPAVVVLRALSQEAGLRVCDLPFAGVIEMAQQQLWTRDPFDRIIVGQAALRKAPLVTKDAAIRRHYRRATWTR
jgi:PIN domain nuclease of toxin-antitoxin system